MSETESEPGSAPAAPTPAAPTPAAPKSRSGALMVAAGIFVSRIAGFVRERALSHTLGTSDASGAFRSALRIPNLLQNLLGEGVLSASFIPVYARLHAEGREAEAAQVARAVMTLLALVASLVTLLGVAFAPQLIDILAPGFDGAVRELTITLVRILFPGTALLVMSAWCLGVLNSHRRFFLSYASPVLWNAALIAVAVAGAGRATTTTGQYDLAMWLAWGAVAGSGLQLLVQIPTVWSLLRSLRPSLAVRTPGVTSTVRAFGPVLLGRGSVQISSYLDQVLASYLGPAMVAAMACAQTIFLLPVSLFGMSVSAAELTEMSRKSGTAEEIAAHLRTRLESGLRQVVFFVIPSAVAFVAVGRTIVGLLYQSGQFTADDTVAVWMILAGSAIGLTAGTQGRLLSSAFYALGDTRTPLRCALIRVGLTFVAGWALALPLRDHLGYAPVWGAVGLTASAGVAAWLEFELLRRALTRRIERVPIPGKRILQCFAAAAVAGAVGFAVEHVLMDLPPWLRALVVLPGFGAVYLGVAQLLGVEAVGGLLRRLRRRR